MQLRPLDWEGAVCSTSLATNQQKFQILCDNCVSNFLPSALQSICNKNRPTFISILPNLIEILQGKIVSLKMYK